ncbi:GntR family transcriptional regulator [Sphingobacterium kyonggiense]|uniref:GntR family transcriptional regulator n=1 Tax=Sphingobacterium kyonggiense TaxID=714075 RepID=A0ABP7YBX5_9SPHI
MKFNNEKPIYLQIIDMVMEKILKKEWKNSEKILSVRDLGSSIEVNPNTVMRAYDKLQQDGIIFNKRGLGFYVAEDAIDKILQNKRQHFLSNEAPLFFQTAKLLQISKEELIELYQNY